VLGLARARPELSDPAPRAIRADRPHFGFGRLVAVPACRGEPGGPHSGRAVRLRYGVEPDLGARTSRWGALG